MVVMATDLSIPNPPEICGQAFMRGTRAYLSLDIAAKCSSAVMAVGVVCNICNARIRMVEVI
jgi:hypothetical protein